VPADAVIDNAEDGFTAEEIVTEICARLPLESSPDYRIRQTACPTSCLIGTRRSDLRNHLAEHEVVAARDTGWDGAPNDALIAAAEEHGFDTTHHRRSDPRNTSRT